MIIEDRVDTLFCKILFHHQLTALGQFINYRGALRRRQPERVLYLAVPLTTYKTFFQLDFPQETIEENQIKMIIYNAEKEVIVKWKK